ncbi:tyrosine recombinase XerC [Clostridium puniceum]|uniref:Tyrosine recombinase XerC n=1 Tax=Clostridium puniceum TaxID=29367 RepID=A0A1S8TD33_9CLOT|nr:tyrosine-type recombinase/integrase [Clostridium puniceum]OOM75656.1 tyrosine recombinase XerC [Clostridium puniceum]
MLRKDRVVFFGQNMSKLLQRWLKYKDAMVENNLLFPAQRTNGMLNTGNFEKNFRRYLKTANINKKITLHGLKNNFSRRFLLSGGNLLVLSKILSNISVEEHVVHEKITSFEIRKY